VFYMLLRREQFVWIFPFGMDWKDIR
jgi:hypothetical protein